MRLRSCVSRRSLPFGICAAIALTSGFAPTEADQKTDSGQNKKPTITVKANPPVGFSPMRSVITAEVKGGSDDYQDFYCASVEWDWGDDTKSETKADCDPYEPGKSEIKRRYVMEHTFRAVTADMSNMSSSQTPQPVQLRVRFSLKQKNKVVGSGQTVIEIRNGMGG